MLDNKISDNLIDSHVSLEQCKKAVTALCNHVLKVQQKRQETELLPGTEENVWLVLAVKKMQPEKRIMPRKIPIVHPLIDPRTTPICLITKDPQREYKDLLEAQNIKFISRVVGIEKLKGKFKPFEARRMLLKENGMFLADERVIPLLPGLLGSIFFKAKKQPIPVCLARKDLKGELERSISSTYMHQNQGTCTSVKIGVVSQTPAQIFDNIKTALPAIVKNIKGGWDNIQSFNIKTNNSMSLPIWSCDLGSGEDARWPVVVEAPWSGFGEGDADDASSDTDEELQKPTPKISDNEGNKKRKAASTPEENEKSAKGQVETTVSDHDVRQKKKSKTSSGKATSLVKESNVAGLESSSLSPQKNEKDRHSTPRTSTKSKVSPDKTTAAEISKGKKKHIKLPSNDSSPQEEPENNTNTSNLTEKEMSSNETKPGGLSKEELKHKKARLSSAKKEKVIKSKAGEKSVKESLIGSKAKSRI